MFLQLVRMFDIFMGCSVTDPAADKRKTDILGKRLMCVLGKTGSLIVVENTGKRNVNFQCNGGQGPYLISILIRD